MKHDTFPGEQPVKRGPGRPRKPQSITPVAAADMGLRAISRRGAAQILGISISTIKRLEKSDPDWPLPFALGSTMRSYLVRDVEAFLLKKVREAQARGTKDGQS